MNLKRTVPLIIYFAVFLIGALLGALFSNAYSSSKAPGYDLGGTYRIVTGENASAQDFAVFNRREGTFIIWRDWTKEDSGTFRCVNEKWGLYSLEGTQGKYVSICCKSEPVILVTAAGEIEVCKFYGREMVNPPEYE